MTDASRQTTAKILLTIGRIALAAIFIVAAYAKTKAPKPQFPGPWAQYASLSPCSPCRSIPTNSSRLQSSAPPPTSLPPFELFVGLWLLSGIALRYAALVTSLLLTVLFAVMVRSYFLGPRNKLRLLRSRRTLSPMTLLRDGSLLALAIAVTVGAFLINRRNEATNRSSHTEAPSLG